MAMNGLSNMAATTLLLVLAIVPAAIAETYAVGGASQWDSGVDYTDWVKGKTFRVGDVLEFKYGAVHSLDVVDKFAFDACDSSSASESHSGGDTKIELKKTGPMYFLCPTPGHCQGGMKLAITVVASPSSPPTSTSPPPSPPPTATPPPPSPPPTATPPPPSRPLAPPPTSKELQPSDGKHEPGRGSTTPPPPPPSPPPPPPSPLPPSMGASNGTMSYVVVGIPLVLACNLWIN